MFLQSVETVRVDGTGRSSFPGLLGSTGAATGLAVFGNRFYWTDRQGLWRADQNPTSVKALIQRDLAALPFMTVVHALQQPQGSVGERRASPKGRPRSFLLCTDGFLLFSMTSAFTLQTSLG